MIAMVIEIGELLATAGSVAEQVGKAINLVKEMHEAGRTTLNHADHARLQSEAPVVHAVISVGGVDEIVRHFLSGA